MQIYMEDTAMFADRKTLNPKKARGILQTIFLTTSLISMGNFSAR